MQKKLGQLMMVGCALAAMFCFVGSAAASVSCTCPDGSTATAPTQATCQTYCGLSSSTSGSATGAGYNSNPIGVYALVANIVNAVLGLTSLAFIGIIIWSGTQFFISQGNADKVKSAKSTLVWAAVGLVVIIAAYAGTTFLFKNLLPTLTAQNRF